MLDQPCSRRRFLALASTSAVAVGVAPFLDPISREREPSPETIALRALRGQKLRLEAADGRSVAARVLDVRSRRRDDVRPRTDHSILLRTALREPLPPGGLRLRHPALPDLPLLLTPVVGEERTLHYELVLSRLDHRPITLV